MSTCVYPDCNRTTYENNDKCIFHYEKDDWFIEDKHGNRDWSASQDKIKEFWEKIRNEKMAQGDYDFSDFVFPEFERTIPFYRNRVAIVRDNRLIAYRKLIYSLDRDCDFWKVGQEIVFNNEVSFRQSIFKGIVNFEKVIFRDKVFFSGACFNNKADFYGTFFENQAFFYRTTFESDTVFDGTVFENDAVFDGTTFHDVVFTDSIFEKIAHFKSIFKNQADFSNTVFKNKADFKGIFENYAIFHETTFLEAHFNATFKALALFSSLKNSTILNFSHAKFEKDSAIEFRNFKVDKFKIEHLQNLSSSFKVTDVIVSNLFELSDTDLGKVELNNFDLRVCKEVVIKDSSFYGAIFNNVKWGKITEDRFKASRDIFRQLKHVLDQQGNIIEANRFYSLEMKEYKKELEAQSLGIDNWQDKLVFFLHEKVSNFSQSWFLPLTWFIVLGIGFSLYKIARTSTFEPFQDWDLLMPTLLISSWIIGKLLSDTIEIFKNTQLEFYSPSILLIIFYLFSVNNPLNEFAKIVNPLGIIRDNEVYKGSEFIWFLHKILMTFIIYQFIVALRRQTKRK